MARCIRFSLILGLGISSLLFSATSYAEREDTEVVDPSRAPTLDISRTKTIDSCEAAISSAEYQPNANILARGTPGQAFHAYDARLSAFRQYLNRAKAFRKNLVQQVASIDDVVKKVFYPMSGNDAALPVLLFPHAKEIIAVDSHPFLPPDFHPGRYSNELIPSKIPGVRTDALKLTQELSEEMYAGPAIIGSLQAALPGFRLISVDILNERRNTISIRFGGATVNVLRSSARIVFDQGEGTPLRQYIHFNDVIPHTYTPEFNDLSWVRSMDAMPPEAVLVKGSMQRLSTRMGHGFNGIQGKFLGWVRESQGLLIEGAELTRSAGSAKLDRRPSIGEMTRTPGNLVAPELVIEAPGLSDSNHFFVHFIE